MVEENGRLPSDDADIPGLSPSPNDNEDEDSTLGELATDSQQIPARATPNIPPASQLEAENPPPTPVGTEAASARANAGAMRTLIGRKGDVANLMSGVTDGMQAKEARKLEEAKLRHERRQEKQRLRHEVKMRRIRSADAEASASRAERAFRMSVSTSFARILYMFSSFPVIHRSSELVSSLNILSSIRHFLRLRFSLLRHKGDQINQAKWIGVIPAQNIEILAEKSILTSATLYSRLPDLSGGSSSYVTSE